jgi:acetyl-CoA carboxylase biotin carboxyl carrier protein
MTIEEIRELIQLVTETGVAELEVQRGENRVRIRRSLAPEASASTVVLPAVPAASGMSAPPQAALSAPPLKADSPSGRPESKTPESLYLQRSPIVGTFYESASPGSPAFVRIGEHVTPGKVLCIIESMKLLNEIEADVAGVVETKLVENGQPVEYGEALFGIRAV